MNRTNAFTATLIIFSALASPARSQICHSLDASDGDPANALFVNNAGNVGIGTQIPASRLVVTSDATRSGDPDTAVTIDASKADATARALLLRASTGPGTVKQLFIVRGDGSVGVGTGIPTSRLVVSSNGFSGMPEWAAEIDSKTSDATTGILHLRNSSAASVLYARSDGNIGIGQTNPSEKLSVVGRIESTAGGFKFPDGTVQTTAANGASGPAGGDLQGYYPDPQINPGRVVRSVEGAHGDVRLHRGPGILVATEADGVTISAYPPALRSWGLGISELAPVQLGAGGLGVYKAPALAIPLPVYWFNETNLGNAWTSGVTTLPALGEVHNPEFSLELFWLTTADGGDVKWFLDYSVRPEFGRMNLDGSVQMTTPVDRIGSDIIYKTVLPITLGFTPSDEVFAFGLGRQSTSDNNPGNVGLLGVRFVYREPQ